jgi:hypothetical protein
MALAALRGLLTGSNGLWPSEQAKQNRIVQKSRRSQTQIIGKFWLYYMAASAGSLVLAAIPLLARALCRAEEKERNAEAI